MGARRDQVQAYRFITRRIVAAMLFGEPETTDRPMRRLGLGVFASFMVTVLVMAGFGVWGLITNQSGDLEENTLVIEEETRATYVYIQDSNGTLRLHPVANYTSALLAIENSEPNERSVPRSAIDDLPRGPRIGIPAAPLSVPSPDALVGLPWRVCSAPPTVEATRPQSTLVMGGDLEGSGLGENALFVEADSGRYLLWNNMRLQMRGPAARTVLGLDTTQPVRVSEQLINALPAGPDIAIIRVPGAGGRSDFVLAGQEATVGRVFIASGQHYVLTREGLVPVGEITAAIRLAGDIELVEISVEAAGRARAPDERRLEPEVYPQSVPSMYPGAGDNTTVCATTNSSGDGAIATTVEVFDSPPPELDPAAPHSVEVRQLGQDDVATVDRAWVGDGGAALVEAAPTDAATSEANTVYLITPEGVRYPLATQTGDAKAALGYGALGPVAVPSTLLDLIPLGPTLDIERAKLPANDGGPAPNARGTGSG